jgi:hypothetical protein
LDNGATHYSAVRGDIKLRTAIAVKLKRENNITYYLYQEDMTKIFSYYQDFLESINRRIPAKSRTVNYGK